jgi:dihydroflavonol-4-reductase
VDLVTGGAGFLGRHVVAALHARGRPVRVLDLAAWPGRPDGVEEMRGSVTDAAAVARAMTGVERVFHLAANPQLWSRRDEDFLEVNHRGTEIVLAKARRAGVARVVHTSSGAVLTGPRRPKAIDETAAPRESDMAGPYALSKWRAERAALAAAEGRPAVVVNPTLPVGPGDHAPTPPTRLLLDLLNGAIPAYLECHLNFIDVRDAAEGHVLAAERGRPGERYILGGTNLRLSELLTVVADLTGLRMPKSRVPGPVALATAKAAEAMARRVTGKPPTATVTGVRLALWSAPMDNAKAVRELGLPVRPLRETLADAIRWAQETGLVRRPLPAFAPTSRDRDRNH